MPKPNTEIVSAAYRAFTQGDFDTAFATITPECEVYDDPRGLDTRVYGRGPRGMLELFAVTSEGFEDVRFFGDAFIDAGDRVLVEAHRVGRGAASGVVVQERQFHVLDMKDGRVVRFRHFLGREDALRAAGLEPGGDS